MSSSHKNKNTHLAQLPTCNMEFPAYNSNETSFTVAQYYGFTGIKTPDVVSSDIDLAKPLQVEGSSIQDELSPIEEKIALIRTYSHTGMQALPQPVSLYYEGLFGGTHEKRKLNKEKCFHLDIIGTHKSIAEATLIQTAMALLKDEGYEHLTVDINSIGTKESATRFAREVAVFYKKHLHLIESPCKQLFKKDVFAMLRCTDDLCKCQELKEKAPQAISFLPDVSRQHIKEVLEFLETLEIPYRINNNLIGNKSYSGETVFQIINTQPNADRRVLAAGSRYNTLAKKIGFKKEIPAVGITIQIKKNTTPKPEPKPIKKSLFFFIQLGFDAKLKSLKVIEILRQARIPVYQSLSRDKISAQLAIAEHQKFPYVLIMGQKEAMENAVLVRHSETRSQETVKISDLCKYLSKIK